jgi:hypothetical protein
MKGEMAFVDQRWIQPFLRVMTLLSLQISPDINHGYRGLDDKNQVYNIMPSCDYDANHDRRSLFHPYIYIYMTHASILSGTPQKHTFTRALLFIS